MSNNCSNDKKLIRYLICNSEYIRIHESDNEIAVIIKTMINNLISEDMIFKEYIRYMNYKYIRHTAYEKLGILLNKINQIRQKNLYYKPLIK